MSRRSEYLAGYTLARERITTDAPSLRPRYIYIFDAGLTYGAGLYKLRTFARELYPAGAKAAERLSLKLFQTPTPSSA